MVKSAKRLVKINFRLHKDYPPVWRVYTTQRVVKGGKPKQIYLGYLPAVTEIKGHYIEKITEKLKQKWEQYFGNRHVDVNWNDANNKWKAITTKTPPPLNAPSLSKNLLLNYQILLCAKEFFGASQKEAYRDSIEPNIKISESSFYQKVDLLVRKGYLVRYPIDKKSSWLDLSDKGENFLDCIQELL